MKTARFADLVKQAGAPETYLLWALPKDDRVFQRALKEHRVLTVHQENVGTRKDYGRVGFHEEEHAQFLVFPKSLRAFADRRIIGINYELLAKESRPGPRPEVAPRAVKRAAAKSNGAKRSARTAKPSKGPKVVAFEKPPPAEPAIDPHVLSVVKQAMRDLDAGKAVAAYKRLEALVNR